MSVGSPPNRSSQIVVVSRAGRHPVLGSWAWCAARLRTPKSPSSEAESALRRQEIALLPACYSELILACSYLLSTSSRDSLRRPLRLARCRAVWCRKSERSRRPGSLAHALSCVARCAAFSGAVLCDEPLGAFGDRASSERVEPGGLVRAVEDGPLGLLSRVLLAAQVSFEMRDISACALRTNGRCVILRLPAKLVSHSCHSPPRDSFAASSAL